MMAADYRHIGGVENRLGRHYSQFSPFSLTPALADQSLARRKLWNAGSNRRSRVRADSVKSPRGGRTGGAAQAPSPVADTDRQGNSLHFPAWGSLTTPVPAVPASQSHSSGSRDPHHRRGS